MGSPDGNGSSTGEGRKGALLLLRGGGSNHAVGSDDRASSLPSANALRPDSNLSLGWYRPAEPEDRPPGRGHRDQWSTHEASGQEDDQPARLTAAAARLDLGAGPAPGDVGDGPLGARRPRPRPRSSPRGGLGRETGLVGLAKLRRLAAIRLAPGAPEVRKPRLPAVVGALLLVALVSAGVAALEQAGSGRHGARAQVGSALNPSQLRRMFLSEGTSRLDALSRAPAVMSVKQPSAIHTRRTSGTARGPASRGSRTGGPRISSNSGNSTPVSHAAATTQPVSPGIPGARTNSGATPPAETPAQTMPVQRSPVQQKPTQQTVH
jgi:hypothetical protein